MSEPSIEKRKVTMTTVEAHMSDDGQVVVGEHKAVDYVPVDILEAYVADARTKWQHVAVGDEHDPGPAGDSGDTVIPAHLEES